MRPVKTPESNQNYELPGGTKDNDLPVERIVTPVKDNLSVVVVRSTWELDTDDLMLLARSHRIELSIWGEPIPPVAMAVLPGEGVEIQRVPPDPPIAWAHLNRAVTLLCDVLNESGDRERPAVPEEVMAGLSECLVKTALPGDTKPQEG